MPKLLIIIGILLVIIGLAWQFEPRLINWFGNLPGDINIKKGNTRVFIPITSMIILSVVISLLVRFLK